MSCWKQICCWCGHLLAIPWCLSSPPPLNHDVTALALSQGREIHLPLFIGIMVYTAQNPSAPSKGRQSQGGTSSACVTVSRSRCSSYKQNIWEWEEMEKNFFFPFQFSQHFDKHTHIPLLCSSDASPVSNLEQQVFSFMWFLMQS